jgi:uncharacterized peroxidase-related enzyme
MKCIDALHFRARAETTDNAVIRCAGYLSWNERINSNDAGLSHKDRRISVEVIKYPSHEPERRNVMSRIKIPVREETPEASQPVLDKVEKMLGFVPNLQRLMSISPAALSGWAGLMGQLSTTLDVKTRDGIALAVSEADGCDYCLAAHSYIAHNLAKIDANEIAINREGKSSDPKRQAAIMFAKRLIETAGKVSDQEFESVRKAGWSDANIIEMIALTAQFLLTNFVNNAVQTPIDFPAVEGAKSKAA